MNNLDDINITSTYFWSENKLMKFCKTIFKRNWTEQDFIDNEPDVVLRSAEISWGPITEQDKLIAKQAEEAVLKELLKDFK